MPLRMRASLTAILLLSLSGCEDAGYTESWVSAGGERSSALRRVGVQIGAEAPNFALWDLDGKAVSLRGQRGRVVLVNFWATWCGPCRIEMPGMESLYQEFNVKGFQILAVSTDLQGAAVTRPFKQEYGLTFPILHDSDYRVGLQYGARTLPMSFLVDRRGLIRHRIFGSRDWDSPEARRLIEYLLNES